MTSSLAHLAFKVNGKEILEKRSFFILSVSVLFGSGATSRE
jgi:hypothetical protein